MARAISIVNMVMAVGWALVALLYFKEDRPGLGWVYVVCSLGWLVAAGFWWRTANINARMNRR